MTGQRPVVLLVTCSALPDGEEWTGTAHLPAAFAHLDPERIPPASED